MLEGDEVTRRSILEEEKEKRQHSQHATNENPVVLGKRGRKPKAALRGAPRRVIGEEEDEDMGELDDFEEEDDLGADEDYDEADDESGYHPNPLNEEDVESAGEDQAAALDELIPEDDEDA